MADLRRYRLHARAIREAASRLGGAVGFGGPTPSLAAIEDILRELADLTADLADGGFERTPELRRIWRRAQLVSARYTWDEAERAIPAPHEARMAEEMRGAEGVR